MSTTSPPPIERLTAADAERRQRRHAGALLRAGIQEGQRVAVIGASDSSLLCCILGALRVGIVPVVINPVLTAEEQEALLSDCRPAAVLSPEHVHRLEEGPEVDLAPWPRARPMHYTSGTTGRPKGVWTGVLTDEHAAALLDEERELWGFSADDVHLVCSPLHHSAPVRFAGGTLAAGGEVVIPTQGFDAAIFAAAVDEHRPTTTFCVPAHLQRLRGTALPDLSSFRLVAHAGAPCPEPLKRWALDTFPRGSVWEFYGSTEAQFTACSPDDWLAAPGTVGRARPGRRLRTADDGTLWCSVPDHARFTYWGDDEKTAEAWDGSEVSVFDVGHLDEEGRLFLDGRRTDLIITGGMNVYPAEVEHVLAAVDGVEEVAVFAVDDERWGQRVCAAVVGRVDPSAVEAHARHHLAGYKRPKDVVVVDALPRNTMGKVRRDALAEVTGLT